MPLFDGSRPSSGPTSGDARQWLADGALLLDVRTPQEFATGHLHGAVNLPVQELALRLNEIATGRKVVVYCQSGARSAAAKALLRGAGHEVLDLGPMPAW